MACDPAPTACDRGAPPGRPSRWATMGRERELAPSRDRPRADRPRADSAYQLGGRCTAREEQGHNLGPTRNELCLKEVCSLVCRNRRQASSAPPDRPAIRPVEPPRLCTSTWMVNRQPGDGSTAASVPRLAHGVTHTSSHRDPNCLRRHLRHHDDRSSHRRFALSPLGARRVR